MTVAAPGFALAGMTRILLALLVTALRPAVVDLRVLAVLPPAPLPLPISGLHVIGTVFC